VATIKWPVSLPMAIPKIVALLFEIADESSGIMSKDGVIVESVTIFPEKGYSEERK
jgi:hypothetical protein